MSLLHLPAQNNSNYIYSFGTPRSLYLDDILCLEDKSGMCVMGIKSGVSNDSMQGWLWLVSECFP